MADAGTYTEVFEKTSIYKCEICDYNTSYKQNFNKHLLSKKHKNEEDLQNGMKSIKSINYECVCGKSYKHRQSLHKHRKKCDGKNKDEIIEELTLKVKKLEESNALAIANTKPQGNTINNIQNNNFDIETQNISKTEIQIFLTEKCANAISIQDFVKQLTITLDDLIETKNNAARGISSIVERNLQPLSITTRPIHHIKDDEWYLKDNNKWREDNGDTFVEETHKGVQKECLRQYAEGGEISNLTDDEQLKLLSFSTSETQPYILNKVKTNIKRKKRVVSLPCWMLCSPPSSVFYRKTPAHTRHAKIQLLFILDDSITQHHIFLGDAGFAW